MSDELNDAVQASPVALPAEDIHHCLQKLVDFDQCVMRSKHFDGCTLEQIAGRLKMNLNTVKSRYTRGPPAAEAVPAASGSRWRMNPGDEWEPSAVLRDLLLDVLEGRASLESPAIRAAMQGEPRFAAFVHSALEVAKDLDDLHAAERRALAAPNDPLEAFAVEVAHSQQRRSPSAIRRWGVLAIAACLALAALLWSGLGPPAAVPVAPSHLGGTPPVQVVFESGTLRFSPSPEPGQHYRIELRLGDRVLPPLTLRRSDRLPVAELGQHGDDVQVRAKLMQGDEELRSSEFLPLKTITGR
jgi:hypothetical protein